MDDTTNAIKLNNHPLGISLDPTITEHIDKPPRPSQEPASDIGQCPRCGSREARHNAWCPGLAPLADSPEGMVGIGSDGEFDAPQPTTSNSQISNSAIGGSQESTTPPDLMALLEKLWAYVDTNNGKNRAPEIYQQLRAAVASLVAENTRQAEEIEKWKDLLRLAIDHRDSFHEELKESRATVTRQSEVIEVAEDLLRLISEEYDRWGNLSTGTRSRIYTALTPPTPQDETK